jgi:hypothetical protein
LKLDSLIAGRHCPGHLVEQLREFSKLVVTLNPNPSRKISGAKRGCRFRQFSNRLGDALAHVPGGSDAEHNE